MPTVHASRAVLILAAATATLLLAPHFDFVPMWDGWVYAECAPTVAPLVGYAAYVLALHIFRPGANALWQTGGYAISAYQLTLR